MTVEVAQNRLRTAVKVGLGFVPLIDATPLIATHELGYFAAEGLDVTLHRELGWANVRDKLAFGRLNAAHALLGLPVKSAIDGHETDGVTNVMALGHGGDAITLSRQLVSAGVDSAVTLGRYVRHGRLERPLTFAHVFDSSVHHYLLRDWLASGEIDPDRDVRLCVLPPMQLPAHLAAGQIDGYCVGEPWNTTADLNGSGRIVALTADLVPQHPDKVLAVNNRWAAENTAAAVAMIRAVIRGSAFCSDPDNIKQLAAWLSRPIYLDAPASTIEASLKLDRNFVSPRAAPHLRPRDWRMRSFERNLPEPHASRVARDADAAVVPR
ncbi:MAG: CmpA/NrtA family ABC transporter substrate-binding protein [Tepidisphaeraceae bacterium]